MNRINPNQMVIGMAPKACPECKHIQHVFFKTKEDYDKWECPECRESKDEDKRG